MLARFPYVAPERKEDPANALPLAAPGRSRRGAFGAPPAPLVSGETPAVGAYGAPVRRLQRCLAAYGYGIGTHGVFDLATETVVTAFQRHFRPARIDGRADPSTLATLAAVLRAAGVAAA